MKYRARQAEIEPQSTLRGHSAPITSLKVSPRTGLLYSASMDATIRVWNVPPPPSAPYPPYDPTIAQGELIGHTDAVWDIAVVREGALLISCGADGATKVWDITTVPGTLQLSWGYNGIGGEALEVPVGAATVEGIRTNLKLVAVAYRDAVVKLFDIESGKETARLSADVNPGESQAEWRRICSILCLQMEHRLRKSIKSFRIRLCPSS